MFMAVYYFPNPIFVLSQAKREEKRQHRDRFYVFLTLTLDGCEWLVSSSKCLTPRDRDTATCWKWCWMNTRIGLDMLENKKSLALTRIIPYFSSLLCNHCTDWATPLHNDEGYEIQDDKTVPGKCFSLLISIKNWEITLSISHIHTQEDIAKQF